MTNMAENQLALFEEVKELRQKENKHFTEVRKAEEDKRLAEDRLADAKRAIKVDEDNLKTKRADWAKKRADLTMAKTRAKIAKTDDEAKAQADLDRTVFKLNTTEANNLRLR